MDLFLSNDAVIIDSLKGRNGASRDINDFSVVLSLVGLVVTLDEETYAPTFSIPENHFAERLDPESRNYKILMHDFASRSVMWMEDQFPSVLAERGRAKDGRGVGPRALYESLLSYNKTQFGNKFWRTIVAQAVLDSDYLEKATEAPTLTPFPGYFR